MCRSVILFVIKHSKNIYERVKAMKKLATRVLCAVLTALLLVSFAPVASAVNSFKKEVVASRLNFDIADNESVTAIVIFEGDSATEMVDKGFKKSLDSARKTVASRQASIKSTIAKEYKAEVLYSYDTLLNGASVKTSYGNLKKIEQMDGVSKVYLANKYSVPTTQIVPKAHIAAEVMGAVPYQSNGGKGTVIAVLDTSFNKDHEALSYYEGIEEAITANDVAAAQDKLNGKGVYLSKKIPFAYDYYDGDSDVMSTAQHGTACAAIAAGNNGDDYYGTAPNAQILGMKVFPDDASGTDSGIYFAALEDAYILGANVISMSLGAQNGFSHDYELEDEVFGNIYATLREKGIFVVVAAGNEYSNGFANNNFLSFSGTDAVTYDYTDYGVVGTPSTYVGNMSVASMENPVYIANVISINGADGVSYYEYVDSSDPEINQGAGFFENFAGRTLDFVMVPGVGAAADFAGIDVNGKVAVVKRGDINFSEKLENSAKAGAIAMICYNNEDGMISMQLSEFPIPAISVTKAVGEAFAAAVDSKVTVEAEMKVVSNENKFLMSDFSSWGCTPDLQLKPQITGIGGMVTCADSLTTDGYIAMSGTSMACPTVAGLIATFISCLGSDLYDEYKEAGFIVDYIEDSLYSNAAIGFDQYGMPYSPRKQGTGLANLDFINGGFAYFDEPIANLGDDADKAGVYKFTTKVMGRPNTVIALESDYSFVVADYLLDYTASGYGIYTDMTSDIIGAAITTDKESYTLDANGEAEITVTVTLNEEGRAYLEQFPNGTFVEGYVHFTVDGAESYLHTTFMGYYGDWTQAPALEKYDWGDYVDALNFLATTVVDEVTGETYLDYGYTPNDLLENNLGFNEGYTAYWEYDEEYDEYFPALNYYLGANGYDYLAYDPSNMAFSTPMTDGTGAYSEMFMIYPALLRNVRHIIMTVSDAETGEVYFVDDTEYMIKNYYDINTGMYTPYSLFYWDGTVADENGEYYYVPSGTVVDVKFETQLDYPGAELVTEREFQVTVDYTAPVTAVEWDADSKQLAVNADDNHKLAAYIVYYYDAENETYESIDLVALNAVAEDTVIDLSTYDFTGIDTFYVDVEDYAGNYVTYEFTPETDYARMIGDVNEDGKISAKDAALVLQADVKLIELNKYDAIAANTTGEDGRVSAADASLILRYDVQLIKDNFGYITLLPNE